MKKPFSAFLVDQYSAVAPLVTADLSGKTVILVGANTGLGFQAVKHFASMKAERIILGCRNESKGKEALKKLKDETGYQRGELWLVDLSSFDSVKDFVNRFEADGGRLDILVMNAAISTPKYETSPHGWESSIQVNNLSTSLMSLLMLPRLLDTAQKYSITPRLVIVSSDTHYWANIGKKVVAKPKIFEALSDKTYSTTGVMRMRYMVTKLLNVLFTRALASRLPTTTPTVIVTTPNPGLTKSELTRNVKGVFIDIVKAVIYGLVAFTTEEGGRALVWGALGGNEEPFERIQGAYTNRAAVAEPSDFVLSTEGHVVQDRIWDETIEILSKVDSRVPEVVAQCLRS